MLLPCWVQACYPPLVPYPKSKTQLDLPALFLPTQETMQTPLSAACNLLPSLVLRTSSHVSGTEQVLNPSLLSLAPGFVQWGDRVQRLGQGGGAETVEAAKRPTLMVSLMMRLVFPQR